MTVARTARRRRKQAVDHFRHMAKIGRGNNNRPIYSTHSSEYYKKHEAMLLERQKAMAARKGKKR
jgi:hypothetical protein